MRNDIRVFCFALSISLVPAFRSNASNRDVDAELNGKSWRLEYETGDQYLVSIEDEVLTWKGLAGADLGRSESDPVQSARIADGIYFLSWSEKDTSHVSVVLNLKSNSVISSGSSPGGVWFQTGMVKPQPYISR